MRSPYPPPRVENAKRPGRRCWAEASRTSRGDSWVGGDPPWVDLRALACFSTQVIARRLQPAGDPFFTGPLCQRLDTGYPDRRRCGLPHLGDRLATCFHQCPGFHLRLVDSACKLWDVHSLGHSVSSFGISSYRPRFPLVTRLASGCSDPPLLAARRLRHLSSGPVGVRFPVRSTLCTRRFPWSSGIFCPHRVIHRIVALVTELLSSSTVKSQVVHRRRVDAALDSGLNGAVISSLRPSATLASIIIIR